MPSSYSNDSRSKSKTTSLGSGLLARAHQEHERRLRRSDPAYRVELIMADGLQGFSGLLRLIAETADRLAGFRNDPFLALLLNRQGLQSKWRIVRAETHPVRGLPVHQKIAEENPGPANQAVLREAIVLNHCKGDTGVALAGAQVGQGIAAINQLPALSLATDLHVPPIHRDPVFGGKG